MQFKLALVVLGASTALASINLRRQSFEALVGLDKRQFQFCGSVPEGTPNPCEVACGPGNIICISLPTCFNPDAGETCCSNGNYCPAGYYCTDAGCCPEGTSVEECGATETLATVPGFANPTSTGAISTVPTSASTVDTTSISSASVPSTSASAPSAPLSGSYSATPTGNATVVTSPSGSPSTPSFSQPAQYTGGAAMRGDAVGWYLGGFYALGMGFFL